MWTKLELGLDDLITSRVNRWVLAEDKTLAMTQGRGTILRLQVRKFDTSNLDFHNLSEAEKNTYENLWGLTDLRQAEVDVRKFIRESIRPYIYSKTNTDEVISGSFFAAVACYTRLNTTAPKIKRLSGAVVHLWTAARMIEGHWYFCGLDTFDVPPNDGKYYLHNAPFLDYEISGVLVDRILMPWRSQVLQNLSDLSYDNKKTNRFALLLANFVLQPTFGLLNTAAKSARNRFQEACAIYISISLINSIHVASRTLLGHFHHLIKGAHSWDYDWTSQEVSRSIAKMADLDDRQVQFLRWLAPKVKENVPQFRELAQTQEYDGDHWFTGQLFLSGWRAPPLVQDAPPA